jgi:hypothetical protein
MYSVLTYVRKLIIEKRPDVMTYGMKYIVTLLVQEVTEINFAVRSLAFYVLCARVFYRGSVCLQLDCMC